MKNFAVFAAVAIVLITLGSCRKIVGDGPVVTETRTTGQFSAIEYGVPADMIFEESDITEIKIEAQQNIINVIETYVSGNELKIKVRNSINIKSSEPIRIMVKAPSVHSLTVNGSGTLNVQNTFSASGATLHVNGSGKMIINKILSSTLNARISGSGSIEALDGSVDEEDISISGSGDINLVPVIARRATTQTSGSGNMRLQVTEQLDVKISGSGDVYYKGTPTVNVNISGSGRIIKI